MIQLELAAVNKDIPPPTIRDLMVFPELGDAWEDLGRSLSFDEQTLQSIKLSSSTPVKRQKQLFRTYLKVSSRPSWKDLVNALERIGKRDVAVKVVDEFELPQELLTAENESLLMDPFSKLGKSVVKSKGVSKTELHKLARDSGIYSPTNSLTKCMVDPDGVSDTTSKSDTQRPQTAQIPAKPRVVADGEAKLSPLSLQSRDRNRSSDDSNFDQSKSKTARVYVPKRRVVADGGGEGSPQSFQSLDLTGDFYFTFNQSKSNTSKLPVSVKPRVKTDGGSPPPSSRLVDQTTLDKKRSRTTQLPVKSEPGISSGSDKSELSFISGRKAPTHDSVHANDDDYYDRKVVEVEDEVDGLSSGDYHSAEDVPPDYRSYSEKFTNTNSTQKENVTEVNNSKVPPRQDVNAPVESTKRLKEAILNRNVEAVCLCISENADLLDAKVEVSVHATPLCTCIYICI